MKLGVKSYLKLDIITDVGSMNVSTYVKISGSMTYHIKELLKKFGCIWVPEQKAWVYDGPRPELLEVTLVELLGFKPIREYSSMFRTTIVMVYDDNIEKLKTRVEEIVKNWPKPVWELSKKMNTV